MTDWFVRQSLMVKVFIAQFPFLLMTVWSFVLLGTADQKESEQIVFCEQPSNGSFNQPINTWSTLGFVVVGMIISTHGALYFQVYKSRMYQQPFIPIAFSCTTSMIGYGSIAFHGYAVQWGGEWDVVSTFLFYSLCLAMSTTLLVGKTQKQWQLVAVWLVYVLLCVVIGFSIPEGLMGVSVACPVLNAVLHLIIIVFPRFRDRRPTRPRYFFASQASLVLALLVWILSREHTSPLCAPDSLLQGHAIWHLLCSFTCALTYIYHCYEKLPTTEAGATSKVDDEEQGPESRGGSDGGDEEKGYNKSNNNNNNIHGMIHGNSSSLSSVGMSLSSPTSSTASSPKATAAVAGEFEATIVVGGEEGTPSPKSKAAAAAAAHRRRHHRDDDDAVLMQV